MADKLIKSLTQNDPLQITLGTRVINSSMFPPSLHNHNPDLTPSFNFPSVCLNLTYSDKTFYKNLHKSLHAKVLRPNQCIR